MSANIVPHTYKISKTDRERLNGHKSLLVFLTGLSGSGKSTIANVLEEFLHKKGIHTYILDGDNVRSGINKNLSFSPTDRTENIRRIAELSKLFLDAGLVVLAAFVAPYEKDRKAIENTVGKENYVEVFVNTSLEVCEQRDVKGLYAKARRGEISNLTGVSAPYEVPKNPSVEVTESNSIEESVEKIYQAIKNNLK